tara:strand:- start:978 stop:1256 length:279 start_codon:yes stop_codon:yes gene_type:complete
LDQAPSGAAKKDKENGYVASSRAIKPALDGKDPIGLAGSSASTVARHGSKVAVLLAGPRRRLRSSHRRAGVLEPASQPAHARRHVLAASDHA